LYQQKYKDSSEYSRKVKFSMNIEANMSNKCTVE